MEDVKAIINVPEGYNGTPIEVRWLEGDAPRTFEYEQLEYSKSVTIPSIAEFINKREWSEDIKKNKAIITYSTDPKNSFIALNTDPADKFSTKLTAKLEINPDLAAFKLNTDTLFSQKELERFIVNYAHCFPDLVTIKRLRQQLLNFIVKFEQAIEKKNDKEGNTKDLVETAIKFVEGSIDRTWDVLMPIFKNGEKVNLTLELEIEKLPNSNHPGFAFYCLEVETLKRNMAEEQILKEIENFSKKFICLEVV